MINTSNWIFKNSPFEMLDLAFKKLFPNVRYTAYFDTLSLGDEEDKGYGVTDFAEDGEITIFIESGLSVLTATEIFAHELAHAGVGAKHEHDEVWEKAFNDLFVEYNRIGAEMFGGERE